jgi:hypothetical protein
MLMPVMIDFNRVELKHADINEKLENWARWVTPGRQSWVSPMFKQYRSKAWQWHPREFSDRARPLEAAAMETAVSGLPEKHRYAIRWAYVWRSSPATAMRALGVSNEGLLLLLRDGRQMLINRR